MTKLQIFVFIALLESVPTFMEMGFVQHFIYFSIQAHSVVDQKHVDLKAK